MFRNTVLDKLPQAINESQGYNCKMIANWVNILCAFLEFGFITFAFDNVAVLLHIKWKKYLYFLLPKR